MNKVCLTCQGTYQEKVTEKVQVIGEAGCHLSHITRKMADRRFMFLMLGLEEAPGC